MGRYHDFCAVLSPKWDKGYNFLAGSAYYDTIIVNTGAKGRKSDISMSEKLKADWPKESGGKS